MDQDNVDYKNQAFWDELCGSGLAKSIGITDASPSSLAKFDEVYLSFYPYLLGYLESRSAPNDRLLEIGLGYGTLSSCLMQKGIYYGLDIAEGPVAMVAERARREGQSPENVQVGSALSIPHGSNFFGSVYSIGCLHHTGDLKRSISEVHRTLAPGGQAVVMLYNRLSYRQLFQAPVKRMKEFRSAGWKVGRETVRGMYDSNSQGEAAPHTDYITVLGAHRLFRHFSEVRVEIRNFDHLTLMKGRLHWSREQLLNNMGRVLGLDLYITAIK